MILGSRGQSWSKSCPMSTSRLTGCRKHVFLMPGTYILQVLMPIKDCPAMGNHLRRGTEVTQKVQFYTI